MAYNPVHMPDGSLDPSMSFYSDDMQTQGNWRGLRKTGDIINGSFGQFKGKYFHSNQTASGMAITSQTNGLQPQTASMTLKHAFGETCSDKSFYQQGELIMITTPEDVNERQGDCYDTTLQMVAGGSLLELQMAMENKTFAFPDLKRPVDDGILKAIDVFQKDWRFGGIFDTRTKLTHNSVLEVAYGDESEFHASLCGMDIGGVSNHILDTWRTSIRNLTNLYLLAYYTFDQKVYSDDKANVKSRNDILDVIEKFYDGPDLHQEQLKAIVSHRRLTIIPFAHASYPHPSDWPYLAEVFKTFPCDQIASLRIGKVIMTPGYSTGNGASPYVSSDESMQTRNGDVVSMPAERVDVEHRASMRVRLYTDPWEVIAI